MGKFVYSFNEGSKDMEKLLGGKGANLAEMTRIGLPVPFGFTVTTEACDKYYEEDKSISEEIIAEVREKLSDLENVTEKKFGDGEKPLLVSVRAGAAISMPGMMDTILNLGLNDVTVEGLAKYAEDENFAYDCYLRFIKTFGKVVLGIPSFKFNTIYSPSPEASMPAEELKKVTKKYKSLIKEYTGRDFPQDPEEQLAESIKAVFGSWNSRRARLYRKLNGIPDTGTAVTVQSMVFGNIGRDSGSGVAFTRNPINGTKRLFGEFILNAQGQDVIGGSRTPQPISSMKKYFPKAFESFQRIAEVLEKHYKDVQYMEFTIEHNKLYMLQTRNADRSCASAVKIAVDMVNENLIDRETALLRIDASQTYQLLYHNFDEEAESKAEIIAKGLSASPGVASGQIYFHSADAEAAAEKGQKVILVRQETLPEDLNGLVTAQGALAERGGITSYAAIVARGMGKCYISGCDMIDVDEKAKTMTVNGEVFAEGDFISMNGSKGLVYRGTIKTVAPQFSKNFETVLSWANSVRRLKIKANADNAKEAGLALNLGAEGIGLCRTEHMFYEEKRIDAIRKMIIADTYWERKETLNEILPYHKDDFKEIFNIVEDKPVTIRLLDLPLDAFFPHKTDEIKALAKEFGVTRAKITEKVMENVEINPMLGQRGCRLLIRYPEIAEMQTKAIMEAAIEMKLEKDIDASVEILIPMVGISGEFNYVRKTVDEAARKCQEEYGVSLDYHIGTMIEVPRAALSADKIAEQAEFFSFGTNDLTQMTYAFSRDDTTGMVSDYMDKGVIEEDPFLTIDRDGVGRLIETAVKLGKQTRPNLRLGVCGEHAGDPKSIEFFEQLGFHYVSCSPLRVPVARIASAQAVIKQRK